MEQLSRIQQAVLSSFLGDSIALGPHWIYDQAEIAQRFPNLQGPAAPQEGSYHPNKTAGEFTHYGDQALVLLESVKSVGVYEEPDFLKRWRAIWPDYIDYIDGATKGTLANISAGKVPIASDSHDLAGASRMAPLLLVSDNEDSFAQYARTQTSLTHGDSRVGDAAEYFARLTSRILSGASVLDAMDSLDSLKLHSLKIVEERAKAKVQKGKTTQEALKNLGLSCDVGVAFSGVLFLIENYANDPKRALIDNALAGGDSAARGMLVGLVLGAATAFDVPNEWVSSKVMMKLINLLQE